MSSQVMHGMVDSGEGEMPGLGVGPFQAPERAARDQPGYALCPLHNIELYTPHMLDSDILSCQAPACL